MHSQRTLEKDFFIARSTNTYMHYLWTATDIFLSIQYLAPTAIKNPSVIQSLLSRGFNITRKHHQKHFLQKGRFSMTLTPDLFRLCIKDQRLKFKLTEMTACTV